jgi:glutamyl endopeptidase
VRRAAVIVLLALTAVSAGLTGARPSAARTDPAPNAVSSVQGAVYVEGGALPGAGDSHPPESMSTESVIGADDRERIQATSSYPSSAIGHLTFNGPGGQFLCTGFLVDADTVLTSGHCVHPGGTGDDGDWYTDHRFTPGRNGYGGRPFGSCWATELWTLPGWFDAGSEYQDLGIVQLDCEVGTETGWLGYFSRPGPRALNGLAAHLRGYPADKPFGTMWTDKGRIRATQVDMAFYQVDTFGGQSGSPVFQWGRHCAGPCAMAVHGYGFAHGSGHHVDNNHGTRITTTREMLIASVAGQNG